MNRRLMVRYAVRSIVSLAGMAVATFWAAGSLNWPMAWAVIVISALWLLGIGVATSRHPGLAVERMDRQRDGVRWDIAVVSAASLVTLVRYIVAGLDLRLGWSSSSGMPIGPIAQVLALLVCALGYGLFVWANLCNPYFSHVVRIQRDRGHVVARGGPYRLIRHPGYLGVVAFEIAVSIALASWPAAVLSVFSVALLVVRTALEDDLLKRELTGYAEYARDIRYRLLPGLW